MSPPDKKYTSFNCWRQQMSSLEKRCEAITSTHHVTEVALVIFLARSWFPSGSFKLCDRVADADVRHQATPERECLRHNVCCQIQNPKQLIPVKTGSHRLWTPPSDDSF